MQRVFRVSAHAAKETQTRRVIGGATGELYSREGAGGGFWRRDRPSEPEARPGEGHVPGDLRAQGLHGLEADLPAQATLEGKVDFETVEIP